MSATVILSHLEAADRAIASGDKDGAAAQFANVLALDPGNVAANNWLGANALSNSDPATAATHFERAAKADPTERSHWLNLAAARRMEGSADRERDALEQALSLDQRDLLALIRLAELHERNGQGGDAAARWAAVLGISAGIANPSPEFVEVLTHARAFLDARKIELADRLDAALSDGLGTAGARDRRRMSRAKDVWLGRSTIFTNHCEGLHYPFLPADEFFDRECFPWFAELEAATAAIRAELEAVLADSGATLEPYISLPPGVPRNKWSPLDKSLDWGAFHLWKEGERFDEACARVPRTAALLDALPMCHIPGRAPNAFFSILKAGSVIPPHTGVTNVRSVVHLGLIVPDDCGFRVGGETVQWREGEAFAFDDTIEHEAWNRSQQDRAVLIIDAWNPHLSEDERRMIEQLYDVADEARR